MDARNRCPKCNAGGSWLQRVDWDRVYKRWEVGCVLCGWRPRADVRRPDDRELRPVITKWSRLGYS